jgi:methyl coenzyme M reductase beta subunit
MGPFIALADAGDAVEEEMAEMIRVRESDGTVRNLVEDQRSILHHLSKLRFRMSRLYVVGPIDDAKLQEIKTEVKSWTSIE